MLYKGARVQSQGSDSEGEREMRQSGRESKYKEVCYQTGYSLPKSIAIDASNRRSLERLYRNTESGNSLLGGGREKN